MALGSICVFGDSIGKGVILHPITRRYEIIKMNIEKLFGRMVNIKNYSMFGCTAPKVLAKVRRHASELTSYSSVFLEVGGNDCDFAWGEIAANPGSEHSPNTPLAEFRSAYRQIIEEIRRYGGKPVVLTLPPLEPNRFFNWVSRGLNRDNILSWLGDVDMIYRWQEMYNIEVMLLATKLDVPIIDIRGAFLKHNRYQDLICPDGIHPNSDGYSLIYKTIGEQYPNISQFREAQ
ncbi:MAG: SGNH/GDSL hydrolase family protein [Bacillota bacterium]|jgi:acyl-CoA thioesterase-1|nr:SGNH/GDSL hydrolase family protein [Bacillota bacterium]HQD19925.1 SGNH/GDSL hydrolase family protein [Bacillota bacterium]